MLSIVLYRSLLGVYFFADDFQVLMNLRDGNLPYFLMRPFGGHNMVVRNALFGLSYAAFGVRPEWFYLTVLLTHAVNVWLLFRVLRNMDVDAAVACLAAVLWATSPMHAGTLAWYCTFGHPLVTTVLLVVLDDLTRLARRGTPPDRSGDHGTPRLLRIRAAKVWQLLPSTK